MYNKHIKSKEVKKEYMEFLSDESRVGPGFAEKIYFPRSIEEVVQIVKNANAENCPITISGGRTGIVGGAVPQGGFLVSLDKMNRFLEVREDRDSGRIIAICEAGMLFKDFVFRAEEETLLHFSNRGRYFYPVDPTEDTAQIGGTVATNASGSRSYKYGSTRRYVRSLKIVLASGELLEIRRGQYILGKDGRVDLPISNGAFKIKNSGYRIPAVKNTAGYFLKPGMDLIDLFIGSEGTLGVICQVELELIPKPIELITVMAFFPSEEDAIEFVEDARRSSKIDPISLEYFDSKTLELLIKRKEQGADIPYLFEDAKAAILFEEGCSSDTMEDVYLKWEEILQTHGSSMDKTWGGIHGKSIERIKKIRHAVPESVNSIIGNRKMVYPEIHKMGTDMSVPDQHLLEIAKFYKNRCQEERFEYLIFGHIGDNHLHVNILPRNPEEMFKAQELYREFAEKVVALGGSVAAEHGIGKVKKEYLKMMFGPSYIDAMVMVKRALDPGWLLNRGNVI